MKKLITLIAIIVSVCVNCNGQNVYIDECTNESDRLRLYHEMCSQYSFRQVDSLSKLYPIHIVYESFYEEIPITNDRGDVLGWKEGNYFREGTYSVYLEIDSTESYEKKAFVYFFGPWISPSIRIEKYNLLVYGSKKQLDEMEKRKQDYCDMLKKKLNLNLRYF